jgi:toxin ParE1/3/4
VLNLVWRERGLAEFEGVLAYIAERNETAADRLKIAAQACAEMIRQHPSMYRAGRVDGTREAVIHPNYILVYRVTADAIEIVSVVHARRKYP